MVAAVIAVAVVAGAVLAVEWMRPLVLPARQQRPNESQQAANRISPSETKLGEGARPVDGFRQTDPQREGRTVAGDSAEIPAVDNHRSWAEVDDPTKDGWDTEAFSDQANQQLKHIGKLIAGAEGIDPARIASLIAPDFTCAALLPEDLSTVFEDPALKVERGSLVPAAKGSQRNSKPRQLYREANGFVQALRAAASPFRVARDVRFKFKVFRVQLSPQDVSTRQYFAVWGRTETGMVEQHATWVVHWSSDATGKPPRLRSIDVEDFEQVTTRQHGGAMFADCTQSILGNNPSYQSQFLRGYNHWLERIQETRYFTLLGTPGISVGDVNGDGLDDLYVCQETRLPNRLFIHQPDGSARDESEQRTVDWLESSRSALLVDLDNDSDQDLVVAVLGGVAVAENDGQGQFSLRDVVATMEDTMSLSAADYDQDGRLDLYVCVYYENDLLLSDDASVASGLLGVDAGPIYDSQDGGSNRLLRNEISAAGNWQLRDVTREVGLDVGNYGHSFAAVWEDYDNDGDQDLYVANDFGVNNLYRNDQLEDGTRRFVEVSAEAGVQDRAFGMSASWADYNRDGWMDLYVANMYSAAGNRVTFQPRFKSHVEPEIKQRFQYMARGNTLLRNSADGRFVDVSAAAAVMMGRWSWSSIFLDVNNDGWEDLFVTNGFVTNDDTGDL